MRSLARFVPVFFRLYHLQTFFPNQPITLTKGLSVSRQFHEPVFTIRFQAAGTMAGKALPPAPPVV
jgi:hypothetical protein